MLTVSCNSNSSQPVQGLDDTPYYDLEGLINAQVYLLDSLNPQVEMLAMISGKQETKVLRKDSAEWAEALGLYAEADLNRPVLRDQYSIKDSYANDFGWQLRTYQAIQPGDVDIPYLKVFYEDDIDNVRRVEALFREENPLYSTLRSMSIGFERRAGRVMITSYTTTGRQKMVLRDSILYQTNARIIY